MDLSRLANRHKYKYPGYRLVNHIKVASPIYSIPLDIVIQKKKDLSIIQEFCLKLISEKINDTKIISELLGIEKNVIDDNISELISNDIAKYNLSSGISITEKGKRVSKELKLEVPVNLNYIFYMDALTGNIYVDDKRLSNHREIQKDSLKSIPIIKSRPTLEDIKFKDIKSAIRKYNNNFNKLSDDLEGDLVYINDMDKPEVQYKYIDLLVFYKKEDNDSDEDEIKIIPFEKSDLIKDYIDLIDIDLVKSVILEKQDDAKYKSILEDVDSKLIEDAKKSELEYEEIEKKLILEKEKEEIIMVDSSIDINNKELQILQKRILSLEEDVKMLSRNRVIHTYEHRDIMIKALRNAKKFVIIISPWIRKPAFDKELENLIYQTVDRNVMVVIGYGISDKKDECDKDIINRLKKLSSQNNNFELVNLPEVAYNTHEKVLICDCEFMVITSFNWLSFAGNPDWGLRQETGYYIEQKNSIDDMIKNVFYRMKLNSLKV